MDMEPKKIETMDDLRAAMNDPELQAAQKEFSKKYLKANRPKSLAVVVVGIVALFLIISFSSHKAASVTPVALRTAETVEVSAAPDHSDQHPLSDQQREALIALLESVKVRRSEKESDEFLKTEHLYFTFANDEPDDWFAVDPAGNLYVVNNCYALADGDGDALWSQLRTVCGIAG